MQKRKSRLYLLGRGLYFSACALYLLSFVLPAFTSEPWDPSNCGAFLLFASCSFAVHGLGPTPQGLPPRSGPNWLSYYFGLLWVCNIPMILIILRSRPGQRRLLYELLLLGGILLAMPIPLLSKNGHGFDGMAYYSWMASMVIALFASVVLRLHGSKESRRTRRLQVPPICEFCGYDLRSQIEPRCPECGTPFESRSLV
jgi:hypothetical protein